MSDYLTSNNVNDRSFAQATDTLNESFKFCLLDNADAAYLVNLMDDLIYDSLAVIDAECSLVRSFYLNLVYHAYRKGTKKTFSTVNDVYLCSFVHAIGEPDWLYAVRRYTRVYRAYWLSVLSDLYDQIPQLEFQVSAQSDIPLDDRVPVKLLLFGVSSSVAYHRIWGILNSLKANWPRIKDIERRVSVPFLRRVGTLARSFSREPEVFMDHYQHGYEGVAIALSKYDSEYGSFASQVNMWVNNRMIYSIKQSNSFIRIPDRMYKLRVAVDRRRKKNPNATLDEISMLEGVDIRLVENAVALHDMQNVASLIDDLDEEGDEPEAYTDVALEQDRETVDMSQQLAHYTAELTAMERLVLFLFYDYESIPVDKLCIDPEDLEYETFRQLSFVLG